MALASPSEATNLRDLEVAARARLDPDDFDYLAGGSDDMRTLRANEEVYADVAIRARRLIDVTDVDTTVDLLGETWPSPIAAAPVGFQAMFHPDGELATARATAAGGHRMIASTLTKWSGWPTTLRPKLAVPPACGTLPSAPEHVTLQL